MTYVIAQPCVDLKDKACIEECPVDCIYEGERSLYIHPDECVDCGACEPVFTVALGVAVLGDRLGPGKVAGGVAVVAGAVLLPLLGGAREPVGSGLQPEYTPTRGSIRR